MAKQTSKPESAPAKKLKDEQPVLGKQPVNEPEQQPTPSLSGPEPLPQRAVTDITDRISIKLADGKLDTSSMRDKTAATFKTILKASMADPEFRNWAGLEIVPNAEQIEELFKPEQAGMLLDVLVMIEAGLMSAKTALSYDECKATLAWTSGEHEILDKQASRIICRYVPAEWLKRADIVIFALMFLSLTATKMRKVSDDAKEKLERIGKAGERPQSIAPATTGPSEQREEAA